MEHDTFPFAASLGNVALVRGLIATGENVNAVDPNGATGLHLTISSGRSSVVISEIISVLLEAGASLNARNNEGYTPLHVAAANGHVEAVVLLIKAGADVNAEIDAGGVTSLFLAIKYDQPDNDCSEVIRLLVEAGASLNLQDANGFSPLRKAAVLGKVNAVRQLILSGANVNEVNNAGKSILLLASRSLKNDENVCQIIEMLLRAGALTNVPDPQGFTPLHAAATSGKVRRVEQLIKAGANVNAIDQSTNRTILHSVIASVHSDEVRFEIVQMLLKAGALLSARNSLSYDALLFAAHLKRIKTVKQLILAGANVYSLHPQYDETCLHLVAKWQGKDDDCRVVVQLLLKAGAKINLCDRNRRTPLHNVAESGNVQLLKQFLEVGADVHAQDSIGRTILVTAISCKKLNKDHPEILRLLLDAGASVEKSDIHGKPLLHHAVSRGFIEIVEQLISAGTDVHAVDESGNSCLHTAALDAKNYTTKCSEIVQILLHAGVSLNGLNKLGETPLHIAVSQGNVEWVEILTKAGANVDAENPGRVTSLYRALKLEKTAKRAEIIRLLTEAGVCVTGPMFETPLRSPIPNGKLSTFELKALVQGYANKHPNSEVSRGLESIRLFEDSNSYRLELIRLLLKADVEERFTPLHYAVIAGDVALVELTVREGDDVNATTSSNETSLHLALRSDLEIIIRHQIVGILLKANASVNVVDRKGDSPLTNALNLNDEEMIQQLIAAGADLRIVDNGRSSCLHKAILNSRGNRDFSRLISLLIGAGAPVNIIDEIHHRTPLHYAASYCCVETVRQLIKAGVDVNVADRDGKTCLHKVLESRSYSVCMQYTPYKTVHPAQEITKLLLEAGAEPDVRDGDGLTPLIRAVQVGDPTSIELLINAGADANAIISDRCTILDWVCNARHSLDLDKPTCKIISLLVAADASIILPGNDISPSHVVLNEKLRSPYLFYLLCQNEVQRMRETIFFGSFTYHQMLRSDRLSRYVRNQSIIEKFERGEFTALFPIYGQDLEESFRVAKARRDLMDQASNGLRRILGFHHSLIHDQILEYLNNEDWLNLRSVQ